VEKLPNPELLEKAIDPSIKGFEDYFKSKGGPLAAYEKEILRAYLWWALVVK
jgi:hypothetical protein